MQKDVLWYNVRYRPDICLEGVGVGAERENNVMLSSHWAEI
jgi:hypothetical protein